MHHVLDYCFKQLNGQLAGLVIATSLLFSANALAIPVVDIHNRQAVQELYNSVYLASNGVNAQWTGNVAACEAGDTSIAYKNAVLQRINYFRSMSGVGADIQFSEEMNRKARLAALMMSANRNLSHQPPDSWVCYSADGAEAAGQANLGLGTHGYEAITLLMEDFGANNTLVGHRRWIYYPQTRVMGTGDIVPTTVFGARTSHATVVEDENLFAARPATRDGFVSWPPPGYVPYPLVFSRWSLSYANADFSNAVIKMTDSAGNPVNLDIIYRSNPPVPGRISAPENTIVWEPSVNPVSAAGRSDVDYTVTVRNVVLDGVDKTFEYTVTAFDPSIAQAVSSAQPQPFLASGTLSVNHQWQLVTSPNESKQPVMIVSSPTLNGGQPGVMQIDNEAGNGNIRIRFREWDYLDKIHAMESVDYLMLEPGSYVLNDGTVAQVGRFSISGTRSWKAIHFQNSFNEPPHVFVNLQTARGGDTATLQVRNINARAFEVSLNEQESKNGSGHIEEEAAYIAIYHPQNTGRLKFINTMNNVLYTLQNIQLSHLWSDVFGYRIKLEEEQSKDAETFHVTENVDVLLIDGKLFTQIVSAIGGDPVAIRQQ